MPQQHIEKTQFSIEWVFNGVPSLVFLQNPHWNEPESGEDRSLEFVLYAVLPVISILLLVLLASLFYHCCSRGKLSLANIVTLNLRDADSSAEFLASLTRNAELHASTTSDGSDGVFVMVYLSPPYEGTLSKITRAASLYSSKDVESMKIEDLEAKLCPDLKSSSQ